MKSGAQSWATASESAMGVHRSIPGWPPERDRRFSANFVGQVGPVGLVGPSRITYYAARSQIFEYVETQHTTIK